MAADLQNIPIFVSEHKWSSDVESNLYSDVEDLCDSANLLDHSKTRSINCLYCAFNITAISILYDNVSIFIPIGKAIILEDFFRKYYVYGNAFVPWVKYKL
jgi:hypothetical protein